MSQLSQEPPVQISTSQNPFQEASQPDETNMSDQIIRKSSRVQEQEIKSNEKPSKSFKETIKFDANLYQSGDDDEDEVSNGSDEQSEKSDSDNEPMENNVSSQVKVKSKNKSKQQVIAPNTAPKNAKLISQIKQRETQQSSKSKLFPQVKVDKNCDIQNVKVVDDYSCYLQMSDIAYNDDEQNRYFNMQLLERNDGNKWFLWIQQGKVGSDRFTNKVTDHFNKYDAMANFEKTFQTKTSNKWVDKDYFVQKPTYYMLVKKDSEKEIIKRYLDLEKEITQSIKDSRVSYQPRKIQGSEVKQLIEKIWDVESMKKVMGEMNLDLDRIPLGKIQKDQVIKSYKILNQIQKILLTEKNKESLINALSNEFYMIIPHNFGIKKPIMIDHLLRIKDKIKILETLQFIAITQSLILNSEMEFKMYHPLDVQYTLTSTQVDLLDPNSLTYEMIETSFSNTQADSHSQFQLSIKNIFSLYKSSEKMRFLPFEKSLHNKFLLWYGAKQPALAAVLREGLKLPYNEVPATPFQFGKGIYFTDCSSKAVNQSLLPNQKSGDGYLVLCEVALGNMNKVFKPTQLAKAPLYYHSVYGVGQQKPKLIGIKDMNLSPESNFAPTELTVCSPSALFFNTGKLAANNDLQDLPPGMQVDHKFNDFVVYNESQVKMRYLVNFHYDLK